MANKKNVAVCGLGHAGRHMIESVEAHPEFELVAAVTTTPESARQGADQVGQPVSGLREGISSALTISSDMDGVLEDSSVDVLLYAGLGSEDDLTESMGKAGDNGKAFITISGFIHPPTSIGAEAAEELNRRAERGGGWILGTGVNPGYLLDALPAAVASLAMPVKRIKARRVTDMRTWGEGAMRESGWGMDPDQIEVSDHLSLKSSLSLIADHFGEMRSEPVEEHEIRVTKVPRSDGRRSLEAGQAMGFIRRARVQAGVTDIELEWVNLYCIDPEQDGDIELTTGVFVEGVSDVSLTIEGSALVDPYPATAARAVNAIGPLTSMPPGLYRPNQVPATPRG